MSSTAQIYSEIIIENIIKRYLQRGEVPTIAEIEAEFDAVADTQDLDSSDFTSAEWIVERKERASASKYNDTFLEVQDDLKVLYRSLLGNSQASAELYQKWQIKADKLESTLKDLEVRISNLLLRSRESDGYFNTVGDKFTDTSKIDLTDTTGIAIDLKQNVVSINRSGTKFTSTDRIFLNDLRADQVFFSIITRNGVVRNNNSDNTLPYFAFLDSNLYWKNRIVTTERVSPLIAELVLTLDTSIEISKIDIELLSSDSNSQVSITPMYSTDGLNYFKLPSQITTITATNIANFQFGTVEVKKLKFILEKLSSDFKEAATFIYEFGFKEIQLGAPAFSITGTTKPTLYSLPLSITKEDKTLAMFNKLTLEVCDGVSDDTRIDYFLSVAKDDDGVPNWIVASGLTTEEDNRLWFPISPLNRDVLLFPDILDLASIADTEISDIGISYSRDGAEGFVSPAVVFQNIETANSLVEVNSVTATEVRYDFLNENQKILDHQIDADADIDDSTLVLWRNIGTQGIVLPDTTKLVRGIQQGWEYKSPYYSCYCLITNPDGATIDVGNNPITVDFTVMTGKVFLAAGTHSIKIHQDYWNYIDPEIETLTELKAADVLYPFNQKLLIEGYLYSETWKEEKVYTGTDRFAGFICDHVSPFDFIQNTIATDYSKFCLDSQIPNTSSATNSRVILVNVNLSRADFMNETFLLEFKLTDDLYSYVALKAEFSTTNTSLTPVLDEYKIKIGV